MPRHANAGAGHGTAEMLAMILRPLWDGAPRAFCSCRRCACLLARLAGAARSLRQVSSHVQRSGDVALGRDAGEVAGHGAAEALAVVSWRLDGRRLAAVLPQAHRLHPPLQRLVPCVLQARRSALVIRSMTLLSLLTLNAQSSVQSHIESMTTTEKRERLEPEDRCWIAFHTPHVHPASTRFKSPRHCPVLGQQPSRALSGSRAPGAGSR